MRLVYGAMMHGTSVSKSSIAPQTGSILLPVAAMLGSITSITVGASFAKTLFPAVGAQGMTALRIGFAAALLCALHRPWRRALGAREAAIIALYGIVLGTMNLLFYMALRTIPVGVAIAIEFIGPLTVAILASRRTLDFVWIALAVAGLALLLPLRAAAQPLDPVGLGYISAAAVCWGLYIVVGQRAGGVPGGQTVALGMVTAALVVVPFGVVHAGAALLAPRAILFGLAVAVLSSAIPYSLEMAALRRLPKHTFGILLSLEPAAGALAGLAILGEHLTAVQWLAIGAIIAASIGAAATARRGGQIGAAP